MRAAWKRVLQGRSFELSLAVCMSSRISVTAAAIAWCRAPLELSNAIRDDGRAFKCTFCYDRQKVGLKPACAKACPTESIQFGEISQLQQKAKDRMAELHGRGMNDATFYDSSHTSVGGTHAMFIVRGDPRSYNLPPNPQIPAIHLKKAWISSAIAAAFLLGGTIAAFLADSGRGES